MCDTILAPPTSTADGIVLFGKNSDRQRNEAHCVEMFPAVEHEAGARLSCTYITIPQVRRTNALILCRPFWIWGAEMGANEHSVVIGNEGLYARIPPPEDNALIGMDLLRLALERATTAAEALEVITTLLEKHGQGGNCGHLTPTFYNNSFMISDPTEAFVLETLGREWVVEEVSGVRAISNEYSIRGKVDGMSAGMLEQLRALGWKEGEEPLNPAEWLADPEKVHIGTARGRYKRAMSMLGSQESRLSVADMMTILRDHDPTGQHASEWNPRLPLKFSLCIHAGSEERFGQTTGSLVSEIRSKNSVHWVTGTSAPCISIFKPMLVDVPLPEHGPRANDRFSPQSLWWRHEQLHRKVLQGDLPKFIDEIRSERDALEAHFRCRVQEVLNGGTVLDRAHVIADCWKVAQHAEESWHAHVNAATDVSDQSAYGMMWEKMNKLAGIDLSH